MPRTALLYSAAFSDNADEDLTVVNSESIQPNTEQKYEVSSADLPLSCPMPAMSLWNSHPKVYLPVEKTGQAVCPYCGARYVLRETGDS